MSNKYVVRYSTENAAYIEGAKMWKTVRFMGVVAVVLWLLF